LEHAGLKPTDLAWAAGIVDGEGCVYIRGQSSPALAVENTSYPMLRRLHELLGGRIRPRPRKDRDKNLTCWEWYSYAGRPCLRILRALRPYLVVKGAQADAVLEYQTYPPHSQARRASLEKLAALKRIDYGE